MSLGFRLALRLQPRGLETRSFLTGDLLPLCLQEGRRLPLGFGLTLGLQPCGLDTRRFLTGFLLPLGLQLGRSVSLGFQPCGLETRSLLLLRLQFGLDLPLSLRQALDLRSGGLEPRRFLPLRLWLSRFLLQPLLRDIVGISSRRACFSRPRVDGDRSRVWRRGRSIGRLFPFGRGPRERTRRGVSRRIGRGRRKRSGRGRLCPGWRARCGRHRRRRCRFIASARCDRRPRQRLSDWLDGALTWCGGRRDEHDAQIGRRDPSISPGGDGAWEPQSVAAQLQVEQHRVHQHRQQQGDRDGSAFTRRALARRRPAPGGPTRSPRRRIGPRRRRSLVGSPREPHAGHRIDSQGSARRSGVAECRTHPRGVRAFRLAAVARRPPDSVRSRISSDAGRTARRPRCGGRSSAKPTVRQHQGQPEHPPAGAWPHAGAHGGLSSRARCACPAGVRPPCRAR